MIDYTKPFDIHQFGYLFLTIGLIFLIMAVASMIIHHIHEESIINGMTFFLLIVGSFLTTIGLLFFI